MAEQLKEQLKHDTDLLEEVENEEKTRAKEVSQLRSEKRRLNQAIGQHMVALGLDEATVPSGTTISRTERRRVQPLKKTAVQAWACQLLGDKQRGLQEVGRLYDAREVKVTQEIVVQRAT